MVNLIGIIASGLFVGVLARYFYPGAVDLGFGMTVLLGVGGALVVGLIANLTSGRPLRDGFNRAGCFSSLLGAMLLIYIGRQLGWGF
ncbi:GlsB/YeaQ/YmgE family stress response membrane protein [Novosphingobium sp.]|uniref:GlsB/YeaQ/YmgE family stress response membrane protein n=1 Tax=Novosphingobium sp. TaxID=1874826 RepID=UPI0022CBDBB1|nr:GlsB/YeaQ/YmgE family stress response membrane protein [Novosphingobium sp.]MCZ8019210.1 GlsB/YeaQ/YmgE family stress response membrane protein [Novosphingobium sp.]MCZ8035018.1 GlsB/YeaQ/YmgE family stress response membrane protein [Novosphingobium sp.]MCZ8052586.1 GlsB/YeaQ/YmgE family stress response membrane protein [Novosphingobium sp.]MCZ8058685.1 GlsB/YeaQ/YmgE family stress response membrane protein [Novosphingobium sp.]MCZ8233082.1 GlsB/YeaQ/YmgE family stress response membrane pro